MASFKPYLLGLLLVVALYSCKAPASIFKFNEHVNADFFKQVTAIAQGTDCEVEAVTGIVVYRAVLLERMVEKEDVLEFAMLNAESKVPYAAYKQIRGYKQELYLLRLITANGLTNACIYIPVKYGPGERLCIGFGPAYFGCVDSLGNKVQFFSEVKVKQQRKQFSLVGKQAVSMLLFADRLPGMGTGGLAVQKIVFESKNKFGGSKPVVFNVAEVFHDPQALFFAAMGTVHFKQP
jgi:hypothetical protein